jgi:hypothetical protein
MEYLIGAALGLGVPVGATIIQFDRDRAFYPLMTIVTASYYVLFAVLGGSLRALSLESMVMLAFIAAAVAGFKTNLWIVVAALMAHGLLDIFHTRLIPNPGVPSYWPMFCLSFDMVAAAYLGWLLTRQRAIPAIDLASSDGTQV